jgi:putative aldouronate transport system substrate-binding protein
LQEIVIKIKGRELKMKRKKRKIVFLTLSISICFIISWVLGLNVRISSAASSQPWKNDRSPYTVKWYVNYDWYTKKWDTKNCLLDRYITQETGITIDILTGNNDKFNAMLASGQLPEVITCARYAVQRYELEESGLLWSIDDLAKKYAPELYEYIPDSMRKMFANEKDGKLYGIVNYFYAPEHMQPIYNKEMYPPNHNELKARKDIMDKLGIKPSDFNTKEGTIKALRKVRDAKIVYNGFQMIPALYIFGDIVEFFAAPREDAKGNYVYVNHTAEALEAAKFLNQLYREKLLPEENLTINDEQRRQMIGRGQVFSWSGSLWDNYIGDLNKMDQKAYPIPVGPLRNSKGSVPTLRPSPSDGWTITMITKKAKKPHRIIWLFDFLYRVRDNHINVIVGPYKYAWVWSKDKKHYELTKQYIDDYNKNRTLADKKYKNGGFDWLVDWLVYYPTVPPASKDSKSYLADKAKQDSNAYFGQYVYNDLPFCNINPPAGSDLAAINSKVGQIATEYVAYMIKAKNEKEVERYFKEMIAKQKQVGFDKLYKYWNEQFQKNKRKLGIKKAWPLKYGSFTEYLK